MEDDGRRPQPAQMLAVWGLAARLLSRRGQLQANVMVGPVLTHQKSPLPAKQWLPGLIRITHPRDRLCNCCSVQVTDAEWVTVNLCDKGQCGSRAMFFSDRAAQLLDSAAIPRRGKPPPRIQ